MNGNPRRGQFEDLLNAHLDGDTSADAGLQKIIAEDRDLFREFSLSMTAAEGLAGLAGAEPPVSFCDRVMETVEARRRGSIFDVLSALWLRPSARFALAGTVLVIVLLAGFFAGRLTVERDRPAAPAVARTATVASPVRFVFFAPQAGDVRLVGDFNGWDKDKTALRRNADGYWTIEIELKPGRYNYLFLVDGNRWSTDPSTAAIEDDGFGKRNSVLEI